MRYIIIFLIGSAASCFGMGISLTNLTETQKQSLGNWRIYSSAHDSNPTLSFSKNEWAPLQFLIIKASTPGDTFLSQAFDRYRARHPVSTPVLVKLLNATYNMQSNPAIIYTLANTYATRVKKIPEGQFAKPLRDTIEFFRGVQNGKLPLDEIYANKLILNPSNRNTHLKPQKPRSVALPSPFLTCQTLSSGPLAASDPSSALPDEPTAEFLQSIQSQQSELMDDMIEYALLQENGMLNLSKQGLNTLEILNRIPDEQKARIQAIDLSGNNIRELPRDVFNGFKSVRMINLAGNKIDDVEKGVFNGLNNLLWLNLANNHIRDLSSQAFDGLSMLRTLYLQGNKLSTLNTGKTPLPNLQVLNLMGNPIRLVNKGYFLNMPKLKNVTINRAFLDGSDLRGLPAASSN